MLAFKPPYSSRARGQPKPRPAHPSPPRPAGRENWGGAFVVIIFLGAFRRTKHPLPRPPPFRGRELLCFFWPPWSSRAPNADEERARRGAGRIPRVQARYTDVPCLDPLSQARGRGQPRGVRPQTAPVPPCTRAIGASVHGTRGSVSLGTFLLRQESTSPSGASTRLEYSRVRRHPI